MTTDIKRSDETDLLIRRQAMKYPDWWMEKVLGVRLWDMQIAIAQATFYYPRVTVRSCESSGKTFVAAGIVLCFLNNYPEGTVITTAPTNRQVEEILWREIRLQFNQSKMPLRGNLTRKALDLGEDWFAIGFATDEPEKMLGMHNANVLVVADDAAGLDNAIFDGMENPLSTGNTHQLLLSNPTQSIGAFRDTFSSKLFRKYKISAYDTPNLTAFGITEEDIASGDWVKKWDGQDLPFPQLISPAKVAERYEEYGKGSYLYTVFTKGEFPDAGINNLFRLSDIENAIARDLPKPEYEKNLRTGGFDVARYGDDESSVSVRQGNKLLDITTWGHQDSVYSAGRTARVMREQRLSRTYVDVVGLGAGVYDILKNELGSEFKILEFDGGKEPLDKERFVNLRAEAYWNFSRKIADGEIDLPDNEKMKAQFVDIRYTYDGKGRLMIEKKEDAKARGSRSPDIADSVVMAFSTRKGSRRTPGYRV